MNSNQSTNSFSSITSMISTKLLNDESHQLIKHLYDQLAAAHNYIGSLEQAKDHLNDINNILTDIIAGQNIVQNQNLIENLDKLRVKEKDYKNANKVLGDLKKNLNLNHLNPNHQINNNVSANLNIGMDDDDYDDDDDVVILEEDDIDDEQNIVVKQEEDIKYPLKINLEEYLNDQVENDEESYDYIMDDDEEDINEEEQEQEQEEWQNETPRRSSLRNKSKSSKTNPATRRRKYNPDIHCGVLSNNSPCKYSLNCIKHTRDQMRLVAGRSKPFDELLKSSSHSNNTYVSKRKYDPDKHCGVLVNGVPCKYGLQCHIHWVGQRKLVPGRSKPLEELLSKKRVSKKEYDPDKHCGVLVDGKPCTYSIVCMLHSHKQRSQVPGRSKSLYKLICEHNLKASKSRAS